MTLCENVHVIGGCWTTCADDAIEHALATRGFVDFDSLSRAGT